MGGVYGVQTENTCVTRSGYLNVVSLSVTEWHLLTKCIIPLSSTPDDEATPIMPPQNDFRGVDYFSKFCDVIRSPFVRIERKIVWCVLCLTLSVVA